MDVESHGSGAWRVKPVGQRVQGAQLQGATTLWKCLVCKAEGMSTLVLSKMKVKILVGKNPTAAKLRLKVGGNLGMQASSQFSFVT
jgi:hypothetical protein